MKKRIKLLISIFSIFAFVLSIFSFNLFKTANAMSIDNSISSTIDDISLVDVDNPNYYFSDNVLEITSNFNYNDFPGGLHEFEPMLELHTINPIVSSTNYDFVILTFTISVDFRYYNSNDETIIFQDYSSWYCYSSDFYSDSSDVYLNSSFKPIFISSYGDNVNSYATSIYTLIDQGDTNSSSFYLYLRFDDDSSYNNFTSFYIRIYDIEIYTYSNMYNRSQFDNSNDVFYNEGYNNGYSSGYSNGYDLGYNNGESVGYNSGYNVGVNEYKTLYDNLVVQYNDLQDLYNDYLDGNVSFNTLVWNIATIPFESFKQIWNVDLLGLNIGNFVTALMFVGVVVFIWKKFL